MSSYPPLALYIDGEWISRQRTTQPVVNPHNGDVLGHVPHAVRDDLDRALHAATKAFPAWSSTPAATRGAVIRRAADIVRERVETFATCLTLEQGKPLREARTEVLRAADLIEFMAHESTRAYGRIIPPRRPGAWRQHVLKEPVGVVAAFAAWNFPAVTPARKISTPLAAGCTLILKASEETPGTAVELVRAFEEAGTPKGVINLVFGEPAFISEHLVPSPLVRKVTFTGSTGVGRIIGAMAGKGVKPVTLELGGHAPVIVDRDNDADVVADLSVQAKFRNAGQVCVSPTRFFVHEGLYDEFVSAFTRGAGRITVGSGLDEESRMGPLANARRIESMERLIADAVEKGATVTTGGRRLGNSGYHFAPTVLTDVPDHAEIMNEEPFGPVAVIRRYKSDEEAVTQANRLRYGLAAYLFTRDGDRQFALADALQCGLVGVNTFWISEPESPWGGVGDSGHGREGGPEGLDSYLTSKYVSQAPYAQG